MPDIALLWGVGIGVVLETIILLRVPSVRDFVFGSRLTRYK